MNHKSISRRPLLKAIGAAGMLAAAEMLLPPWSRLTAADAQAGELSGDTIDLTISEHPFA